MGYCTPDIGAYLGADKSCGGSSNGNKVDEVCGGSCPYYCLCADAKKNTTAGTENQNPLIKCCKKGANMGVKDGVIIGNSTCTKAVVSSSRSVFACLLSIGIVIVAAGL
mmetsp:Transcript_31802/g.62532  ORF Transcript_31802/g.62532 Transcript_31802/m.62532 type:complete len:109 (-) Transcript_31802:32-358(-)